MSLSRRGKATRMGSESLPHVPTIAESGYPEYEVDFWMGVVAPAKTPDATISQFASWFTAALQASDVKPKLVTQGLDPVGMCGTNFIAHIRKQYDDYGRAIRDANIKVE